MLSGNDCLSSPPVLCRRHRNSDLNSNEKKNILAVIQPWDSVKPLFAGYVPHVITSMVEGPCAFHRLKVQGFG
jgi:hypothetical protein